MNIEKPEREGLYNFSWEGIGFERRTSFDFYEFENCYIVQGLAEMYKVDELEDFVPKVKKLKPDFDLSKAYIVTKDGEKVVYRG